jgi:putative transport protein
MTAFLVETPLFVLFLVAAIGFLVGRIHVRGFSLGVSAVLFVGLAVGALDPAIGLPAIIYEFGLIVFVYTVGLAGGPGFVAALRRDGVRENALVVGVLALAAMLVVLADRLLDLTAPQAAGLFSGSLTNTPALATILESLTGGAEDAVVAEPVVAYSLAYPVGVLGVIVAISVLTRRWGTDGDEQRELQRLGVSAEELVDVTVEVTRDLGDRDVADLSTTDPLDRVMLARHQRGGRQWLVRGDDVLRPGDRVSVVGPPAAVRAAVDLLGEPRDEPLMQHGDLDYRRIFVSTPETVGRTVAELDLPGRFDATVTRVRHGDMDRLAMPDMVLEPGDRVRVVAPRGRMADVTRYFGDSWKALSEIDVGVFGLGIALGLLVGSVPVPLPGGTTFSLGLAGGPLVVGLAVGALGRTGPIVWQLPYNANLTLRQVGVILFLAGVGTRSGHGFVTTVGDGGLPLFAAGAAVTCVTATAALLLGHHVLHVPVSVLTGIVAGVHTQPAVLAFANDRAGNEAPDLGYATVFPVATIAKILLAQLLLTVLS